jgi:hypothetical protein
MTDRTLELAVRFISDALIENPSAPIGAIIDAAGRKFDLTPLQVDQLLQSYLEKKIDSEPR